MAGNDPICVSVLAVDDDEDTLAMLKTLLEQDGHECVVAATAAAALARCKERHFDCMLLDVQLGDASGLAVAERLAAMPESRPSHIVLMSGHPRENFAAALRNGLVDGHITKPADIDELLDRVRKALNPPHSISPL